MCLRHLSSSTAFIPANWVPQSVSPLQLVEANGPAHLCHQEEICSIPWNQLQMTTVLRTCCTFGGTSCPVVYILFTFLRVPWTLDSPIQYNLRFSNSNSTSLSGIATITQLSNFSVQIHIKLFIVFYLKIAIIFHAYFSSTPNTPTTLTLFLITSSFVFYPSRIQFEHLNLIHFDISAIEELPSSSPPHTYSGFLLFSHPSHQPSPWRQKRVSEISSCMSVWCGH